MTWTGALPVLALAVLFDAIRFLFQQFWFFGPALAAAYCTAEISSKVGVMVGGFLCTAGATTAGAFAVPVLESFGIIMAMATGLIGWMTMGLYLIITNGRMFKENTGNILWFAGSLLVSEIPLVGTIPAFTGIMVRLYHTQIKKEKLALEDYKKKHAAADLRDRQERIAAALQAVQRQEAANEAAFDEADIEEGEEIPEEVRRAA